MVTIEFKGRSQAFFVGEQSQRFWENLIPEFHGRPTGIFKAPEKLRTYGLNDFEKYDCVLPSRKFLMDLKLHKQSFEIVSASVVGGLYTNDEMHEHRLADAIRLTVPGGLFVARVTQKQLTLSWAFFAKKLDRVCMTEEDGFYNVTGLKMRIPKLLGEKDDGRTVDEDGFKAKIKDLFAGNNRFDPQHYEVKPMTDGSAPKDWTTRHLTAEYLDRLLPHAPAEGLQDEIKPMLELEQVPYPPGVAEAGKFLASGSFNGQDVVELGDGSLALVGGYSLQRHVKLPEEIDPLTGDKLYTEYTVNESIGRALILEAADGSEFDEGDWCYARF